MTTRCCPDCAEPVAVKANAKEGRCEKCRPEPRRSHSKMRPSTQGRRKPPIPFYYS